VSFAAGVITKIREQNSGLIEFYLGGRKEDYDIFGIDFSGNSRVHEAVGTSLGGKEILKEYACGYDSTNGCGDGENNEFMACAWRFYNTSDLRPDSYIIDFCSTEWELNLLAANYGMRTSNSVQQRNANTTPNMNSLVLKLTPWMNGVFGQNSPSMMFLGGFENDVTAIDDLGCDEVTKSAQNYVCLRDAANFYKELNYPGFENGLNSDVLMVPHNGRCTNGDADAEFFKDVFDKNATRALAVISSDVTLESNRNPRCSVIRNLADAYQNIDNNGKIRNDYVECREKTSGGTFQFKEEEYPGDVHMILSLKVTVV